MDYNFKKIEKKWQDFWSSCADLDTKFKNTDNKKYCLTMFSYPSGDSCILVTGIIMAQLIHFLDFLN